MDIRDINIVIDDMETYISALEEVGEDGLAGKLAETLSAWEKASEEVEQIELVD